MRWPGTYRHDPRGIIDSFGLYAQVLNLNRVKMQGAGTPCTYYNNTAWDEFGNYNKNSIRCYCWKEGAAHPDHKHFLCMGTGVLSGYQKYGYREEVFAFPSKEAGDLTTSSAIIGRVNSESIQDSFQISSNLLEGDCFTKRIVMERFLSVDRFIAMDNADITNNKVEYSYSLNNVDWIPIVMEPYIRTKLGNKQSTGFSLPEGTTEIWFRIKLRKKTAAAPSPAWHSIRFRYRKMRTLFDIYPRHIINEPSFLVGREQTITELKKGNLGAEIRYPQRFWVLPEVNITNTDVIEFYNGPWAYKKFLIKNVERRLHGPEQFETSKIFETDVIRDNTDVMGILDYLY